LTYTKKDPKAEKIQAVSDLSKILDSSTIILTDFQGLDVKGISALRRKLREAGSGYVVVKNTLFDLAASDLPAKALTSDLAGPTAIVHTNEDPVAAAKALQDFMKGPKAIKIKSGMVDGSVYNAKQLEALSKIPPKQELYAMVVGGLQSPITGLVGTLQTLISQFVFTLQAVADKKAA